jgi:SAM-dependent methyltransferase
VTTTKSAQTLSCPACEQSAYERLYERNGCEILRCEKCGLGRAKPEGFDPDSYYTDGYFSGDRADGYADYRGSESVLRREFAGLVEFVRRFRPGGRLLDVGCAYGFFLQEAKSHFSVAGIEIAEDAAAFCRSQGLDVVTGVADEATLAGVGKLDVIVLLDVIEHLPDPKGTLALCARHLNPGGIIVLTTGDFGSPVARVMGANWRLMTPPQHLWFFTRDSIARLANSLGLRIEHHDHPWKIVPLSLIVFQVRRMLGMPARSAAAISTVGVPVNLFDAMRVVLRTPG